MAGRAFGLSLLCLFLAVAPLRAEEGEADPLDEDLEEPWLVDRAHDFLSGSIQDSAAWLDSFFSDERAEAERNRSRIRIRGGPYWERGQGTKFNTKYSIRLSLPGTGRRLNLLIAGDSDDDQDLEDSPEDEIRDRATETDRENVAAGLQYFLLDEAQRNLSVLGGVRLSGATPVGLFGARYRRYWELDPWGLRFTQRGLVLTDNEVIVPSRLDFERPVADDILFRHTLAGTWFKSEDGYFYNVDFALIQRVDDKTAISYEFANQFQTEPSNRLEESAFRIRYRQKIWREWLRLDVTPQMAFPRERDFDLTPGLYVGFEVTFGG